MKNLIEHTPALDCYTMQKAGVLRPNVRVSGTWGWHEGQSLGYSIDTTDVDHAEIWLDYSIEGEPVRYAVCLHIAFLPKNGWRIGFLCPLSKGNKACDRQVRTLYLPAGGRYFGCRHCYDLDYVTSQQNHCHTGFFGMLERESGQPAAEWHGGWLDLVKGFRQRAKGFAVMG
jgi:hypothetical protein